MRHLSIRPKVGNRQGVVLLETGGKAVIQHKHLIINATIGNPILEEQDAIDFLTELVSSIDMKIIKGPFAHYVEADGNRGMTATVMIETSHIAFHIWDEKDPAEIKFDLYTCGSLDAGQVLQILDKQFGFSSVEWMLLDREEGFKQLGHGEK
jgi:S-adenosylmethionine/arginine decarboxylase-like enzyme